MEWLKNSLATYSVKIRAEFFLCTLEYYILLIIRPYETILHVIIFQYSTNWSIINAN